VLKFKRKFRRLKVKIQV